MPFIVFQYFYCPRLIAESMKKTDRNDAHILLDLSRKQYMPESYLPSKEIREAVLFFPFLDKIEN